MGNGGILYFLEIVKNIVIIIELIILWEAGILIFFLKSLKILP